MRLLATTASNNQPDFQHELQAVREDPDVRSFAHRRAKSPEMAEDALQSAYYAVSRVAHPEAIEDLRAYFCRVVLREIYRELRQLRAEVLVDFTVSGDARQDQRGIGAPMPRPLTEEVQTCLLGQGWLGIFTGRGELAARVPRRSPDPGRYQRLIVRVAEYVLRVILGENADADINAALRGGYAEWFAAHNSSRDTRDQRLSRGRADVCALLQTIVERGDLIS